MNTRRHKHRLTFTTSKLLFSATWVRWGVRWKACPAGRPTGGAAAYTKEYSNMAKGQKRGNREAKKPKQNKPKKVESKLSKVAETFGSKLNPQPKKGGKK